MLIDINKMLVFICLIIVSTFIHQKLFFSSSPNNFRVISHPKDYRLLLVISAFHFRLFRLAASSVLHIIAMLDDDAWTHKPPKRGERIILFRRLYRIHCQLDRIHSVISPTRRA